MTTERVVTIPELNVESALSAISDSVVRLVPAAPPTIYVKTERIADVCRYLKETPGIELDYLSCLTAVDYLDRFEVVYHLHSISRGHALTVKVEVDRDAAEVPSVTSIWRGADFQEREAYDLMGITFTGHPNLKRILLYDEFVGHPLRKDFALPRD